MLEYTQNRRLKVPSGRIIAESLSQRAFSGQPSRYRSASIHLAELLRRAGCLPLEDGPVLPRHPWVWGEATRVLSIQLLLGAFDPQSESLLLFTGSRKKPDSAYQ